MQLLKVIILALLVVLFFRDSEAQNTNPVERQVANPITDTPNINPISAEQDIKAPKPKKTSFEQEGGNDEVVIYSSHQEVQGEDGKHIIVYSGNVDVKLGIYRLQADKVTIKEAENKMYAEGSVVFDQGDDQRITGSSGVWNLKTKLGYFENSTGFTNQTQDGTVIYFTADKVERTALDTVVVTKGKFTACDEAVPKWSFTADEATIKMNDKVKLKNGKFRVKDVPLIPLPYASIPIKERDRASGFLTPTIGFSGNKGLRISTAYFQTLGKSADVTFRADVYSSRGIGYGLDVRTRANSRSFFNFGFFAVKDRIFGAKADANHPDQGGSIAYAEGVQYFSNGFTAAADVRITSSLAFRQVFSDGVQQIISPIEMSQAFINKSWNNYTLNLLARSQVISIPNVTVSTRNLPSVHFEKRPAQLSFLKGAYFAFKTSIEGVSRREEVADIAAYRAKTGSDPIVTPTLGQRFDIYPQVTVPLTTKYVNFTATGAIRATYYSDSLDGSRQVVGTDLIRKYGEFQFDIRPVAFAKNYYGKGDAFKFRHVIEPFATYRLVKGVNNFDRIIRFDELDTITDTNEIEFGIANRIYTRRYPEAISDESQRKLSQTVSLNGISLASVNANRPGSAEPSEKPKSDAVSSIQAIIDRAGKKKTAELSIQPYEIFSLVIRGKYFFDKTFGGALIPGQRNQIEPITALSFYTFGGVPRRFSPLNVDVTYRPKQNIFFNTRMDVGVQGDAVRDISASVGYETPLLKIFQTFYYTRAVDLIPSLASTISASPTSPASLPVILPNGTVISPAATSGVISGAPIVRSDGTIVSPPPAGSIVAGPDPALAGVAGFSTAPFGSTVSPEAGTVKGVIKEPGTLRGSQWSPSIFIGNRDKGLYTGASVFLDFENRRAGGLSPLISSLYTVGYAYDCCSVAVQFYSFNVGARNENRLLFSFRLKGIGAFGTEQFGQGLR